MAFWYINITYRVSGNETSKIWGNNKLNKKP